MRYICGSYWVAGGMEAFTHLVVADGEMMQYYCQRVQTYFGFSTISTARLHGSVSICPSSSGQTCHLPHRIATENVEQLCFFSFCGCLIKGSCTGMCYPCLVGASICIKQRWVTWFLLFLLLLLCALVHVREKIHYL